MHSSMNYLTISIVSLMVDKLRAHHHSVQLMGCHFVLSAVDRSAQMAWDGIRAAEQEIIRIEELISSWKETSQTSEINRCAGVRSVSVDVELFCLIDRAIRISELTAGCFDISGTVARDYWKFHGENQERLCNEDLFHLRTLIDYRNIELDSYRHSVHLKMAEMKIGFGGIGKGYAAYKASEIMKNMGIRSGLINASGDLLCWGCPPNNSSWEVNIPQPDNRLYGAVRFNIPEGSIVTSGDYEHYVMVEGERHSHIIDPRTALPIRDLRSVSVLSPNPEFADAMATAISVLGPDDGVDLVDRLHGIECFIIDSSGEQYMSKGLAA